MVVTFAQVGLGVDSIYAHVPHQPANLLPVEGSARFAPQNLRNGPIAPGGFIGMNFIDPAHEKQVLFVDDRRARLSVDAGPGNAEKLCLTFDGKP
jgi:hypothetical protein